MLCNLVAASSLQHFRWRVICLLPPQQAAARLQQLGVPTDSLHLRGLRDLPLLVPRLVRRLREHPVDLVHCWNYYANSFGGVAAAMTGTPSIWYLGHSRFTREGTKWKTRAMAHAGSVLSKLASTIVTCADSGREAHIRLGYRADQIRVIRNGFDTERFRPDPEARQSVRQEPGIQDGMMLIGCLARFHPDKDPLNFIEAAARLRTNGTAVHFLCAGQGMDWDNRVLADALEQAGLRDRFHLLGWREDAERVNAALDIATSSSRTEGFPNAVGEAMACGVPCVVTDVGDAAQLVADSGNVTLPRNPAALAQGWEQLISLGEEGRTKLGRRARSRVERFYSLPVVAARYGEVYQQVLDKSRKNLAS